MPPGRRGRTFLPSLLFAIPCWLRAEAGPQVAAAVPDIESKFVVSHQLGLYHMTILQPMTEPHGCAGEGGTRKEGRGEQDFHDQVEKALETETLVLTNLWVLLFLLGPEPGTISQSP